MLSDDAAQFLTLLRDQPEASLCPECAVQRLSLAKWDVMKLIRELITDGLVLARYQRCESCFDEKLVVTMRSRPSAR